MDSFTLAKEAHANQLRAAMKRWKRTHSAADLIRLIDTYNQRPVDRRMPSLRIQGYNVIQLEG